jgi:flagellin-like protein
MNRRAITPLIGVVILVIITLLLASMFAVTTTGLADFGSERKQVDYLTGLSSDGTQKGNYRSELIWARDNGSDETTSHVVNYTIASGSDTAGNSLNSIVIEYPDGSADVGGVDARADIIIVGIDQNRDGDVDVDATDDVECCPPDDGVKTSNGENTLTIELSGNYNLNGGDALIVEFKNVENPGSGDYSVTVGINGDVTDGGTLEIKA